MWLQPQLAAIHSPPPTLACDLISRLYCIGCRVSSVITMHTFLQRHIFMYRHTPICLKCCLFFRVLAHFLSHMSFSKKSNSCGSIVGVSVNFCQLTKSPLSLQTQSPSKDRIFEKIKAFWSSISHFLNSYWITRRYLRGDLFSKHFSWFRAKKCAII